MPNSEYQPPFKGSSFKSYTQPDGEVVVYLSHTPESIKYLADLTEASKDKDDAIKLAFGDGPIPPMLQKLIDKGSEEFFGAIIFPIIPHFMSTCEKLPHTMIVGSILYPFAKAALPISVSLLRIEDGDNINSASQLEEFRKKADPSRIKSFTLNLVLDESFAESYTLALTSAQNKVSLY